MKERNIVSNVVAKEALRKTQLETLETLRDTIKNSFGPMGSHTIIAKSDIVNEYTKDGHTIIDNVQMMGIIETTVKENIVDLTRNIVKTVGDGTTSAVILAAEIFKALTEKEVSINITPYQLMNEFSKVVTDVSAKILSGKKEVTPDDIYKIALISTNGNVDVALALQEIYTKFDNEVFIDVSVSPNENSYIKTYDGITLETGYSDIAYVNTKDNKCSIRNPKIYVFADPVDSPDLIAMLDTIIIKNILEPLRDNVPENIVPTVILAPKLSRDLSGYMEMTITELLRYKGNNITMKPPFLIVTNIYDMDRYDDIVKLCGCKPIRKYIDPKYQKIDIEKGIAPTPETVLDFCGSCDLIESDSAKTKFINPADMVDEDGNYTTTYEGLVEYLENEIKVATENKETTTTIGKMKRRLQSLKSNLVEYFIGGITVIDRDNTRALVEDAVLNCRSAAKTGYGYAANFEGYRAVNNLIKETIAKGANDDHEAEYLELLQLIKRSYEAVIQILYTVSGVTDPIKVMKDTLEVDAPYNVKTKSFDMNVISSINTDVMILDTISRIIVLMFTANQYLCPTIANNQY